MRLEIDGEAARDPIRRDDVLLRAVRLACAFTMRLEAEIGVAAMELVRAKNALETMRLGAFTCHSHDFCDANEVMHLAFLGVVQRAVDHDAPADVALWNDAWRLAYNASFNVEWINVEVFSGGGASTGRCIPAVVRRDVGRVETLFAESVTVQADERLSVTSRD